MQSRFSRKQFLAGSSVLALSSLVFGCGGGKKRNSHNNEDPLTRIANDLRSGEYVRRDQYTAYINRYVRASQFPNSGSAAEQHAWLSGPITGALLQAYITSPYAARTTESGQFRPIQIDGYFRETTHFVVEVSKAPNLASYSSEVSCQPANGNASDRQKGAYARVSASATNYATGIEEMATYEEAVQRTNKGVTEGRFTSAALSIDVNILQSSSTKFAGYSNAEVITAAVQVYLPLFQTEAFRKSLDSGTCHYIEIDLQTGVATQKDDACQTVSTPVPVNNTNYNAYQVDDVTSSLLFVAEQKSDGSRLFFFGERDPDGKPSSFSSMDFVSKSGGTEQTDSFSFDTDGKVTKFISSNRVVFDFDWQSPTVAVVRVQAPSEATSVTTSVDFSKRSSGSTSQSHKAISAHSTDIDTSARSNKRLSISKRQRQKSFASYRTRQASTGSCAVRLYRCGSLDEFPSQVYVTLLKNVGGQFFNASPNNRSYPAVYQGGGLYVAQLPTGVGVKTVNIGKLYEQLSNAIQSGCEAFDNQMGGLLGVEYMCVQLTLAIAAIPNPLTELGAASILAVCSAAGIGLEALCKVAQSRILQAADEWLLGENAPLPLQSYNVDLISQIFVRAFTPGLPNDFFSNTAEVVKGQVFPSLRLDVGGTTEIGQIQFAPRLPVAGEGYSASASIFCMKNGSNGTIGVFGTDGYRDSREIVSLADGGNQSFDIYVPGASEPGIQDTITITVQNPDGASTTRSDFIVFR